MPTSANRASGCLPVIFVLPIDTPVTQKAWPITQIGDRPGDREWAWVELNYRPHAYQACALTT